MASVKIGSLFVRTLAKPISSALKSRAKEHPRFREWTISLAQFLHRTDIRMRVNLAGESPKNIRPLNDAKAVDQGATFISEAFLFSVAVSLILAETIRGRMKTANRRDSVDDKFDELTAQIDALRQQVENYQAEQQARIAEDTQRSDNISNLVETVIDVGLRGGWMSRALENDGEFAKRRQSLERLTRVDIPLTGDDEELSQTGAEQSVSAEQVEDVK